MNSNNAINVNDSSIAFKRQATIPSHLNSALFNVRYVPSVLCKTFEESEDEVDGTELVIDSPGSDSSFSSSAASSSTTEDENVFGCGSDSTLTSDDEDEPSSPSTPTHIIVTNYDLPEYDVLRSITMSFSTIDSIRSWPSHTSFYNDYCPAAVANATPISESANGLQLITPPKSTRGRLNKDVRSYWDGRKPKVVVKLPTVVVTEPNGNRRGALYAEEILTADDLAEADEEIKRLLEQASQAKRTVTAGMFQCTPRPAPSIPGQSKPSSIKTYAMQRRPSFRGVSIKQRPAIKQITPLEQKDLPEPPKQEQSPSILNTKQASPRVRFAPLPTRADAESEKKLSPVHNPCPTAPLRSILINSEKPAIRGILSTGKTASSRSLLQRKRNVSFACKDSIHEFQRWNYAEEQGCDYSSTQERATPLVSILSVPGKSTSRCQSNVSFATEVEIREFERWNYAEADTEEAVHSDEEVSEDEVIQDSATPLRSILFKGVKQPHTLLLHTRSASFACHDQIREVERWIETEEQQEAIQPNGGNAWDDVDDVLTLESTLAFLSRPSHWY